MYTHICFARFQQITWFCKFHDVVNVDATHGTNREGYIGNSLALLRYKLYQFLVTDGMGFGRPMMYAFVISEKYTSLRIMFQLFRDIMGIQYPVSTMVMDKFALQMRAARVVFGCDVLLCYFHVRQAISKYVSTPIFHGLCHF